MLPTLSARTRYGRACNHGRVRREATSTVAYVSLLLGEVHSKAEPIAATEHARVVALAGRIVQQPHIAGPEAPRFSVAGREFHLTLERNHEPTLWGRMPGSVP